MNIVVKSFSHCEWCYQTTSLDVYGTELKMRFASFIVQYLGILCCRCCFSTFLHMHMLTGASLTGYTVIPGAYSVPPALLTHAAGVWINQFNTLHLSPQSLSHSLSLTENFFFVILFMSLKYNFLTICIHLLPSPASPLPASLCPQGHGKDWKFVSKDEGRRRYWHHRRRKRRGRESDSPQPALSARNTPWR